MKYFVIGLGNFGSALCLKLMEQGHEVIGIDNNLQRVTNIQEHITHAVQLDSTNSMAIKNLPIHEADAVVVAIGEDVGAATTTVALLKQMGIQRIISRALSPIHQTIIEAIGVHEIIHPEEEAADRLAHRLDLKDILDSFDLFDKHKVIEIKAPKQYIGRKIGETDVRTKYNLNILTVIKRRVIKNLFGKQQTKPYVMDTISSKTELEEGDILVVFGRITDLRSFINDKCN